MLKGKCIGIIGCGNMGEAIIKGILAKNVVPKSRMLISDVRESRVIYIKHKYGLKDTDSRALTQNCDILILAVKPQDLGKVINEISKSLSSKKLLISILAGVKIEKILKFSKKKTQVARVMPNMGALVGESMSAVSFSKGTKGENKKIVMMIFSSFGQIVEIHERQMDTITAISGSGPAYFFYLIEALAKIAVKRGINKETAERLAVKTAIGSVKLLSHIKQSPQILRGKITSKGGTTEAALKVFEKKNLEGIIEEAVTAAANRSEELSGGE